MDLKGRVSGAVLLALLFSASVTTLTNPSATARGDVPPPVVAEGQGGGPHARDEARHRADPLTLAPARTAIVPRAASPLVVPYTGKLQREVFGFAPYWSLAQNANWNYGLLSTIAYFGLDVNGDGSFATTTRGWAGWTSQDLVDVINRAHAAGDRVVVVIKAFDEATINAIVTTGATQTAITNTINAIAAKNLDGVNVDFEGSSNSSYPNIQAGMTSFMGKLSAQVHQRFPGSMVSVDTYSGSASWDGGFFNIGTLAPVVDAFFVMAYDMSFGNMSGQAGPNAPLTGWTYNDTTSVAQYTSKAPASKVILGVPYFGYKWSTTSTQPYARAVSGSGASADTYAGVLDDFSCALQLTRSWDDTAASPWASWWSPATGDPCAGNRNSWRELYYDDATSLGRKYDLVNANNLRGTGMWALGYDGTSQDLWGVLSAKFTAAAQYDVSGVPRNWAVNQTQTFTVRVTNTGNQPWPSGGDNPVRLGLHFATTAGGWPAQVKSGFKAWLTDQRVPLPADLGPGQSVDLSITATAPATTAATVLEAQMVREGQFWFNQWAAQPVTVAPPTWIANYDMSQAPRTWAVNQSQTFPITVTNAGNQTWPAGGPTPVHLGLHFATAAGGWPQQAASYLTAWRSDQRVSLPNDLAPGQSAALTVTTTAPSTTGATVLEAETVKEQSFWFSQWAPVSIRLAPQAWLAGYDMRAVPKTWQPGQSQTVTVSVTNTGNQPWPSAGSTPVRLSLHFATASGGWPKQVASYFSAWQTDQRISLPADLPPGQSVSLSATVTAPSTGAPAVLEAEMVKEQQFWFGEWTAVSLTSASPLSLAGYDLAAAPRVWSANQQATFDVTVTNTGNQVWTAGGPNPVRLGLHFATAPGGWPAQTASYLRAWLTDQRVSLPQDLAPGQSVTLHVTITAPAAGNPIVLEGEMVKEQQFWFSDWAPVAVALSP